MTGIGISLEDLGIQSRVAGKRSAKHDGYPREYDFSLELALYGSWSLTRNGMLSTLRLLGVNLGMWIPIFWTRAENETEDSVREMLTQMSYDKEMHRNFRTCLSMVCRGSFIGSEALARLMSIKGYKRGIIRNGLALNQRVPTSVLSQLMREGTSSFALQMLKNPSLPAELVRAIYNRKTGWGRPLNWVANAESKVPADVLESIINEYDPAADLTSSGSSWFYGTLAQRPDMSERLLISLFGKCHPDRILSSEACTKKVVDEFQRLMPSGGALEPDDREVAVRALRKVRSAIKTGRTGAITRNGGSELELLNAVRADPDLGVFEAHQFVSPLSDDF